MVPERIPRNSSNVVYEDYRGNMLSRTEQKKIGVNNIEK